MRLVKLGESWINPEWVTQVVRVEVGDRIGQTRVTLAGSPSDRIYVKRSVDEVCKALTSDTEIPGESMNTPGHFTVRTAG